MRRQEQVFGQSLNEEEIKDMEIDKLVLQKMVRKNIIDYIAKYYELDVSDKKVFENIKNSKIFKNNDENNYFDKNVFKAHFLVNICKQIISNLLKAIF